jgi:dihydroflavonol-4-reductase
MPTAFVTGGTGFLGLNLVHVLRERGWHVIAVHRASSKTQRLAGLGAELRVADIGDLPALTHAMPEGVDAVFHVAADVTWWKLDRERQERVNVVGTRNVVDASLARKAKRFIHTSSGAAYGINHTDVVREDSKSTAQDSPFGYVRTKWLAEQEVKNAVGKGLPAVLINPAHIIGPYDTTSWGRLFPLVKAGKIPGVPPGRASFCHARSVVDAHIRAVTQGKIGDNYLLGGADASYTEFFALIAELVGVKPPKVAPAFMLKTAGRVGEWLSYFTRKEPDVTLGIATLMCADWRVDDSKAKRELGYASVSLRQMTEDCYQWLKTEHLV